MRTWTLAILTVLAIGVHQGYRAMPAPETAINAQNRSTAHRSNRPLPPHAYRYRARPHPRAYAAPIGPPNPKLDLIPRSTVPRFTPKRKHWLDHTDRDYVI